MNTVCNKKKEG